MTSKISFLAMSLLLIWLGSCTPTPSSPVHTTHNDWQQKFPNVLRLQNVPDSASDRSPSAFSDHGSWFAYALPTTNTPDGIGSFVGPYLFTQDNGVWISRFLSKLNIAVGDSLQQLNFAEAEVLENNAYPGFLQQQLHFALSGLHLSSKLQFINQYTASISLEVKADQDILLQLGWHGNTFMEGVRFHKKADGVQISFDQNNHQGHITLPGVAELAIQTTDTSYQLKTPPTKLATGEVLQLTLYHTFCFSAGEWEEARQALPISIEAQHVADLANSKRWNTWLQTIIGDLEAPFQDKSHEEVAVKCLQTLTGNWRSAAGFLPHQGLFPSYHYEWFHGFWAWDSWKHAVSLARFHAPLAQDQILAMFDFQNAEGMVADCVYRDTIIENHNWRNTKPPLAAWAIWKTYEQHKDKEFLATVYPLAKRYHDWWYQYRDYDQNGLCEYGSTDGTLIAAKWESGMDNAVRFDETRLLKSASQDGAWSMNRESVDLNAYLFADKHYLALIAAELGNQLQANAFQEAADSLKTSIQQIFFSEETGWFHDIDLESKKPILHYGAEGWIPLWVGAASRAQAEAVRNNMVDSTKFATYIPFPTLAADEAGFEPTESYWRGPVWLDQAYFAISALKKYGFKDDAQRFTLQLTERLEGLKDDGAPIRENYDPLSGKGYESAHFSWSAAHLLLLLTETQDYIYHQ